MAKTILELKFEEEIRDKMFLAKKECNYIRLAFIR